MTDSPDAPASFNAVAAALRRDAADVTTYAHVLTETLGEALPRGCVTVERHRGLAQRVRGARGVVRRIVVRLGGRVLALEVVDSQPVAEIAHEVRGVTLSRERVRLETWIETLAQELVAHAEADARTAEALRRFVS